MTTDRGEPTEPTARPSTETQPLRRTTSTFAGNAVAILLVVAVAGAIGVGAARAYLLRLPAAAPSVTPRPSEIASVIPTLTPIPLPSFTPTPTPSATPTPSPTPTARPTPTPRPTPTRTPGKTP